MQLLLYRKEDLVLVAKTSFGKSLVWQILPCLVPGTVVIAILPLLALGVEQANSIQKYLAVNAGARPMFVNSKNISKSVLRDIQKGYYTHILVSPELLTGKEFRPLLEDPYFRSMIKWVVVDEFHLVSVWGKDFRKSYAMLEVIRHTLGNKPWFGCTATLDSNIWQKVCFSTGMKESTHTIQTPIDRPEVALIRNVVKKADIDKRAMFFMAFYPQIVQRQQLNNRLDIDEKTGTSDRTKRGLFDSFSAQ
jgi:superfamily II DNA helicase RecQ